MKLFLIFLFLPIIGFAQIGTISIADSTIAGEAIGKDKNYLYWQTEEAIYRVRHNRLQWIALSNGENTMDNIPKMQHFGQLLSKGASKQRAGIAVSLIGTVAGTLVGVLAKDSIENSIEIGVGISAASGIIGILLQSSGLQDLEMAGKYAAIDDL